MSVPNRKTIKDAREEEELAPLLEPREKPLPQWKRLLYFLGGIVCVLLGIAGWLVPVVTGIPFYIAGAILLGLSSSKARRIINKLDRKLPLRFRKKLREAIKRFGGRRKK